MRARSAMPAAQPHRWQFKAELYDEALDLARRTPCDPRTLTRAARDLAEERPAFAVGAGLLALHWLVLGYGHEITGADVWAAYSTTMTAAETNGNPAEVREQVRKLVAAEKADGFVARIIGRELGRSAAYGRMPPSSRTSSAGAAIGSP